VRKTTFRDYLSARHQESTIRAHEQNLRYFKQWIRAAALPGARRVRYADMLSYVQYEQRRGITVATINLRLCSIRKYYAYLLAGGQVSADPARGLYIKGNLRRVIEQPLTVAALEDLYLLYSQRPKGCRSGLSHPRNIVMAGLLIYQGLHSGELRRLEVGHVRLAEGRIYIPGSARNNSRELPLDPRQMLALDRYLSQIRPGLRPKGQELLPGNIRNHLGALIVELQGIQPGVRNALHIRASVILEWLKVHNKRQLQYMMGYWHIGSAERYAVQEMDSLTDQLSKHHPFG
jgi:site-specific recombinase XerD